MDIFILLSLIFVGLILGSFSTVCIYRLPKDISIVHPGSFCTFCKKPISWFHNIPLFSFIFLKGRSSCCNKEISLVYPLTEFLSVSSILILYFWFGQINENFIFTSLFILGLIILFFTDFLFFILPNTVVFFLYITGFIQILFNYPLGFTDGLTGMVSGIVFFYFIAKLYKIIRKKEGMGMGDVKLVGALGLWIGLSGLIFVIPISAILGIFYIIILVALKKMKLKEQIPYGCFLIISAIGWYFY